MTPTGNAQAGVTPLLDLRDITKTFFGVQVLKSVHLQVALGETIGLVGENGAGKSTLMNILGGALHSDAGTMRIAGKPYAPRSPQDAERVGVAFIHQELNLFPNLSIAENIHIARLPRRGILPWLNRAALREQTKLLLQRVQLDLSPDMLVEELSGGERQLVEIAKALSVDAKLIILDEPTTSLTARESERLFALMRDLRERGVAMVYVSHALSDVLQLSDRVVVMRDGAVVGSAASRDLTIDQMVSMMVGRSISQFFPPRTNTVSATPALELRGVTQPGLVEDVSLTLHQGEVLGIGGLMGAGRSELAQVIFGLEPMQRGEIFLNGARLTGRSPRSAIESGLAFLTEDRRHEGLCMEASIGDNMALVTLPEAGRGPARWIDASRMDAHLGGIRKAVRLTASARLGQPVRTLSGGNQQKVVLAKWLLRKPKVLILDEPTRGIDVGAKVEIYTLINQLAGSGAGILMISSDLEELIGMCDRILVMQRGEIRDEIARPDFNRERILKSALHETTR